MIGQRRKRTLMIHLLAMSAFVGPTPDGNQVLHENDIKTDNRLTNLSHGTPKKNMADARKNGWDNRGEKSSSAKLTEDDVREILSLISTGVPQCDIAKKFKVSQAQVCRIKYGIRWAHLQEKPE